MDVRQIGGSIISIPETAIIDNKTGDRYMLREVEYPTDTCFWINGSEGQNIRFVMVFPAVAQESEDRGLFHPQQSVAP